MLLKLIVYDLKNGILKCGVKYLLAIPVFFFVCFDFYLRIAQLLSVRPMPLLSTLGDYFFAAFIGINEYVPSRTESFLFPVAWIGIFLYLAFVLLYYPSTDLERAGQNTLIRCRGRVIWWVAKCVWVLASVLLYFALGYATIFVFALCVGASPSLEISEYVSGLFFIQYDKLCYAGGVLWRELFVGPALTAVAISLVQMLLSLYIKPFYSFIVTVLVYLSASYYVSPFFIGNYAMSSRSGQYITNGVDPGVGIFVGVGISLFCLVAGALLFRKYDIFNRE